MSTEWIKPLEWDAEGAEPSDALKTEGFKAGYKPPADTFNYFLHNSQECIEQVQDEVDNVNNRIDTTNQSVETIRSDMTKEDTKLSSKIDTALNDVNTTLATAKSELQAADATLSQKIDDNISNVNKSMTDADTALSKRIDDTNSNLASHTHDDRYYTETETDKKLDDKVDKVTGKGLSTNDYTTAEKNKLADIATGAEVNQNAFAKVAIGKTTIEADTKSDTLTLEAGSNVTLTPDANNDKVTIAAKDTTYGAATTSSAGLMSAADKTKLDGIATEANKYSLPAAGNDLGGVKSGGDVTISNGEITVKDNSHNHTVDNLSGTVPLAKGGTGATDAETARANLGLDKVNNTLDSEKNVAFASEAGEARKVQYPLTVRIKGGSTEGTDLWTYDGSTSRSINLTPAKLGASEEGHKHTLDDVSETTEKKVKRIVAATSTDGIAYTATVDGITELYNGMEITIIPSINNAGTSPTLNINSLGAVRIYRPLSFSTFVANAPEANFIRANTPCRLMYHANYVSGGIWLIAEKQKTSAQDLYGDVPIESGGTGASDAETARENLGLGSVATESTVPISKGGTGATDAAGARENLEITPANIGAAEASHGTHVSYATTTPEMDGTASVGSASTVARSDHKHPTDTSRAPMYAYGTTDLAAGTSELETGKLYFVYE